MRAIGIDISYWQSKFEYKAGDFVILRAAYGTARDIKFDEFYSAIPDNIIRGAYHYLRSRHDWKRQADTFLEIVKEKKFDFYVLDFELYGNTLSTQFSRAAKAWIDYIKSETGKKVLLYTNNYIYKDWLQGFDHYPLWIAQYPSANWDWIKQYVVEDTSQPWITINRDWKFWQFTSKAPGNVYGVKSKSVDLNFYNGTVEELRDWLDYVPAELSDKEKLNILWEYYKQNV